MLALQGCLRKKMLRQAQHDVMGEYFSEIVILSEVEET